MADDIEAFLKRAAERRKSQQGGQPARPQAAPAQPVPTPQRPQAFQPQATPAPMITRVEPEVIDAELVDEEDFSRLTDRHLQDRHLAQEVGLADDKMDAHIHEVFDHRVGRLAHRKRANPLAQESTAAMLMELLQSPQGLQQAVLLREIFDRPDHRW